MTGPCGRAGMVTEVGSASSSRADRHVLERVRVQALGSARVVAAAAGRYHSAAVTEDGALWTWGLGYEGQLGLGDLEDRLVPACS